MTYARISIALAVWALACACAQTGAPPATPMTQQDVAEAAPAKMVRAPAFYDVRDYGARGDGRTLDSPAVNAAIAAAAAAGGGTVRFPPGDYLCGSIHLKSNVALEIDRATTITASASGDAYDPAEPALNAFQDFGHSHWRNSLFWGENLENIAITGHGVINAGALPTNPRPTDPLGNKTISLKLCRNVTLRDFTMLRGGHFAILATGVDNFTIDNLRIDTNRDGMDIDCCRNVRVSNCTVNSPIDDAICLKSTYALGMNRATDNVTITNCQVSGYEVGSLLDGTYRRRPTVLGGRAPNGRIKFGTESNGGFRNITVSNCVFDYCMGLALEMVDGGTLEDVSVSNLTMRDVAYSAIYVRLGRRARGPDSPSSGTLRRVSISNVVAYNVDPRYSAVQIMGIPGHNVEDLTLSNIRVYSLGGGTSQQAQLTPREDELGYPEPNQYGLIPAYGAYIRHVRDIQIDNMQIHSLRADQRPALRLDDVRGADLMRIKAQHAPGVPTFRLTGVSGFNLRQWETNADVKSDKVAEKSF